MGLGVALAAAASAFFGDAALWFRTLVSVVPLLAAVATLHIF